MSNIPSTWLDRLLGINITANGAAVDKQPTLDFGAGLVVTPDPTNQRINVAAVYAAAQYALDAGSAALSAGDRVALLATGANNLVVTRGTDAACKAAGGGLGLVDAAYAPGATNVKVLLSGTIPATVSGLGTTTAGPVYWANGRLAKVSRPTGVDYAGFTDGSGKVTVRETTVGFLASGIPVYNILQYGGAADCDLGTGYLTGAPGTPPTDNTAAFNAAQAAIAASGFPGVIYFPASPHANAGYYFASTVSLTTAGITLRGDSGLGAASNGQGSWIIGNATTNGNPIVKVSRTATGAKFSHLGFAHPSQYANQQWNPSTGMFANGRVVPRDASYGYILQPIDDTFRHSGAVQPTFPHDWDYRKKYHAKDRILVWIEDDVTAGLLHPYIYENQRDGFSSYVGPAISNQAPTWAASTATVVGAFRRPTDPHYTGIAYIASVVAGDTKTGLTEPTWPTVADATVVDGNVTWRAFMDIWPRTVGQIMTEGASGAGFTAVTTPAAQWQLVDVSGQIDESALGAGGTMIWVIGQMNNGLRAEGVFHVEHCLFYNVNGDAINVHGSVGDNTAVNGASVVDAAVVNCAGSGVYLIGDDANACSFKDLNIIGMMGWGIYDQSFLGNSYYACQIAPRLGGYSAADPTHGYAYGRGPVHSLGVVSNNAFYSVYAEGGQPPSRVTSPSMVFSPLGGFGFFDETSALDYLSGGRFYPHETYSFPMAKVWAPGIAVSTGDVFSPNATSVGKVYDLTTIVGTGPAYDPTHPTLTVTEPTWASALTNGTAVTGTGTNNGNPMTLTYTCFQVDQAILTIGSQSNPEVALDLKFNDQTHSLSLLDHAPNVGEIGWVRDKQVSQPLFSFDIASTRLFVRIAYELRCGSNADASWRWQAKADAHLNGANPGSIDWYYDAALGDPLGHFVTVKGATDTLVNAGKLWTDAEEKFRSLRLTFGGQTKNDATTGSVAAAYPLVSTDENICVTMDATLTTLHTLDAIPTHKFEDVVVKVIAETVDGSNNPDGTAQAVFLLQGSCKESAGALTAIMAPAVLYGQPTDATHNAGGNSATWAAVLDFSTSTTPRVRVTGAAATRVAWRCIVEPLR